MKYLLNADCKKSSFFTSFQSPEYCPKVGSGGYAILIALYKNNATSEKSKMWRQELIDAAEEYSNESMNRRKPGANQFYTPWCTSTTLVKKQLIIKLGNPVKIWLTDKGLALAEKIMVSRDIVRDMGATNNSSNRNLNFDETPPAPPTQLNQSFRLNALPSNWNVRPRGNPRKPTRYVICKAVDFSKLPKKYLLFPSILGFFPIMKKKIGF